MLVFYVRREGCSLQLVANLDTKTIQVGYCLYNGKGTRLASQKDLHEVARKFVDNGFTQLIKL